LFKKISIILIIIIQVFTLTGCTLYIGWDEIEIQGIGIIKVPRGLELSQVDGKYYISDRPINDRLSRVYFTQTFLFDGSIKEESNYFADSIKILDFDRNYSSGRSTYGTLSCLIDNKIESLEFFTLSNGNNESVTMISWPDKSEIGVVKKISNAFESF
jgi:lipoprotein